MTTATARVLPRPSEVPARHLPRLVWRGARNVTAAGREFMSATDLGRGLDATVRAEIVQERRAEYAARVGLARRVVGYAVVSVWALAGVAAVAVHGWSVWAALAQVAVAVLVASPWSNVGRAVHLRTSAKATAKSKDAAEAKAAVSSLSQMAMLVLAQVAMTWPIVMVGTSLVLWSWAGVAYAAALGVGGFFLAVAGVVVLVAFAWRDGSVLDDLGIERPKDGPPPEGLLSRAVASAVLGAKGPKVPELAATVRVTAPGVAVLPDGGWRATVELPDAAVATEAVKKAAGIASFLEIDAGWLVVTQGAHDGQIIMSGYDHDPYAQGGDHCPLAVNPEPTSVWDPVRIGRTLTGDPVTITLAYSGVLIGGRPRVGKTVALLDILAHVLCDPDCDVMIGDGKEVDTWAVKDLATVYVGADPEAFSAMLEGLLARIDTARATLRGVGKRLTRENSATSGIRPAVLLVDELAYFTRPVQARHREVAEVIIDQLARIVEYGPAFGVWVVLATQYPRGDVIDARIRQIPIRVALPTADRLASDLILGEGSNARGHRSHLFPATTTGVAVVKASMVQTTVIDYFDAEDDLARIAAYATGLRGELGALPAPTVTPEILDRARVVFETLGTDRLPSVTLAAELGYDSPEALADVLRPLGIRSRDVRTDGGTRKGYRIDMFGGATTPATPPATGGRQVGDNVIPLRPRSHALPRVSPRVVAPQEEQS